MEFGDGNLPKTNLEECSYVREQVFQVENARGAAAPTQILVPFGLCSVTHDI